MAKLTGNALHVLGPAPAVSLEEFEPMWKIWPVGNKEEAYIEVAYGVAHKKLLDGKPLTIVFLMDKYREYVNHAQNRSNDPKFTANIANWMRKARYNEEFVAPSNPSIKRVIK